MRHIHLDPVGGAAGDMILAAMLDALPELRAPVLAHIAAVLPQGVTAHLAEGRNGGFRGLHFGLEGVGQGGRHHDDHHHAHDHHAHDHHHHDHGQDHAHDHHHHAHDHPHHLHHHAPLLIHDGGHHHDAGRDPHPVTYPDFAARIRAAGLPDAVQRHALAMLRRLGEAEAHVHGIPLDQVHFHEIADWDTLADLTGAASVMAALDGARFSVGPLPLGGGHITAAHGRIALPAPATLEILRGYDWQDDGITGERITPTGAAILAELTGGTNGQRTGGRLTATGAGLGTRNLPGIGNLLRVQIFDAAPALPEAQAVEALICDLDDMTGEEISHAAAHLRAAEGVLDVTLIAAQGKKGRPVTRLEVIARPEQAERIAALILTETASLGLRRHRLSRQTLPRVAGEGVKTASRPDGTETIKAEADRLAATPGLAARRALKARLEEG